MAYVPTISLAPSAVERWTTCTASPEFLLENKKRLPNDRTQFNVEGNQAHLIANAVLLGRKIPTHCPKTGKIDPEKIPEMTRYAKGFKNYCLSEIGLTEWKTEQQIDLFYRPESNGYIDFIGLVPMKLIKVVDLKYGQGVAVSAEENDQMAIYARSYIEQELIEGLDFDDDTQISMAIWQPRVRDGDIESTWTIPWRELKEHTDRIASIARMIIANKPGTTVFAPSEDACRWCPAKTFCKAKNDPALKLVPSKVVEGKLVLPSPNAMNEEQIAYLLRHGKDLVKWIEDSKKVFYSRALDGHIPKGYKLVKGRGGRKWEDPDDAIETLEMYLSEEVVRPRGIISPNQAEAALAEVGLGKDSLPKIRHFTGKPALALLEDSRPSINVDPTSVFEDVSEDDLPSTDEMSDLL